MLLILAIVYLFHGNIQAAPVSNLIPRDAVESPLNANPSHQCPDQQRSLWDILWSCLAAIFACTWVTVHPNIPPAGEKWWKSFGRKVELMAWGILAPEMIVYWAMKQWIGARKLEEKYHDLGWTKTHGFFLQMGGFTLYKGDVRQHVLLHKRLADLLEIGAIEFPKITEEEIEDRSKGDGLSKAIAVGQSLWFVVQCIARHIQGLAITELELATVSFAAINGVIYFLWWKKPLGVRCSVPVYLLAKPKKMPTKVEVVENPDSTTQRRGAITGFIETATTFLKGIWTSIRGASAQDVKEAIKNTIVWFSLAILGFVIFTLPAALFAVFGPLFSITARMGEIFKPDQAGDSEAASVKTFYYTYDKDDTDNLTPFITTIVASVFGGLHCAGWFFTYPSHAEMMIWRVCSAFTAALPWALIADKLLMDDMENDNSDEICPWCCCCEFSLLLTVTPILILCVMGYIISRLLLLGEAFAALRFLPPNALAVVEWVEFLPHI